MKKTSKGIKGITLVSLVITIIVLLILAGITLNITIGERGIITKAQQAGKNYLNAQAEEERQLNLLDGELANYIGGSGNNSGNTGNPQELIEFKKKIAEAITNQGVNTSENDSTDTIVNNIDIMAKEQYNKGAQYKLTLVKADLSSRYNQTVSCVDIENFQDLTVDDFIIVNKSMQWAGSSDGVEVHVMSKNYDATTGTLTLGMQKSFTSQNTWTFWNVYDVYLYRP